MQAKKADKSKMNKGAGKAADKAVKNVAAKAGKAGRK